MLSCLPPRSLLSHSRRIGHGLPRDRLPRDRLALTSGAVNVVLAPIGAFPMCHGAGGLVVQHRFAGRTGLAPALFGVTCLSLGVLFGRDALGLLSVLPLAAVGALLVIAGTDLAYNKPMRRSRPDGLVVIPLTRLTCVIMNVGRDSWPGFSLNLYERSSCADTRPCERNAERTSLCPVGDSSALGKVRMS